MKLWIKQLEYQKLYVTETKHQVNRVPTIVTVNESIEGDAIKR